MFGLEKLEKQQHEVVLMLCRMVAVKDGNTGEHIERVGEYAYRIGKYIGLDNKEVEMLKVAAKIHDIGKVFVPDEILLSSNKLSKNDLTIMQKHTTKGHTMISECTHNEILNYARDVVLFHHERWDGSGYPTGGKGEIIPLSARIVAISDVFDALVNSRGYKEAWRVDDALNYIKQNSGKQFDPEVTDAFLNTIDKHFNMSFERNNNPFIWAGAELAESNI